MVSLNATNFIIHHLFGPIHCIISTSHYSVYISMFIYVHVVYACTYVSHFFYSFDKDSFYILVAVLALLYSVLISLLADTYKVIRSFILRLLCESCILNLVYSLFNSHQNYSL